MLNENLKEYIDLDELSEEIFSIDVSIERAKKILENLREEDEVFDGEFEDDKWIFELHLFKGNKVSFDFSVLNDAVKFSNLWDSSPVNIVKCWIADLLSKWYPSSVAQKFSLLITAIQYTNFFSPAKLNDFIEYLRNYSPIVKKYMDNKITVNNIMDTKKKIKEDFEGVAVVLGIIRTVLNFLTFAESDSFYSYHKPLMDIRKGLPTTKNIRELPKGKDVLKLDLCINQYFESGLSSIPRLLFAPILLWWKITNIIPMRISEFCTIERDCISPINGSYFITLPREKQEGSKQRVQVVDTLEITKDIYDLINDYIQLTNPYGESKTLISYKTFLEIDKVNYRGAKKINTEYFNSTVFGRLLTRFYKKIVYAEYNKLVEREVNPNDTRHFAFCSLLMQGISPIEIARLGGHSTLESQYHYSNHTEYFIDIEVDKLIKGFKRNGRELRGTTFEGYEISYKDIETKSFQFPSNKTRLPMKIGFCTDDLQRCESEECMLCKNWWIHPENLVKVKPIIEEKIRNRRQKIIEMGIFLKNLNESFSATMVSDVDPNVFIKMETEAGSIQDHLEQIARLEMLKGYDEQ